MLKKKTALKSWLQEGEGIVAVNPAQIMEETEVFDGDLTSWPWSSGKANSLGPYPPNNDPPKRFQPFGAPSSFIPSINLQLPIHPPRVTPPVTGRRLDGPVPEHEPGAAGAGEPLAPLREEAVRGDAAHALLQPSASASAEAPRLGALVPPDSEVGRRRRSEAKGRTEGANRTVRVCFTERLMQQVNRFQDRFISQSCGHRSHRGLVLGGSLKCAWTVNRFSKKGPFIQT